MPGLSSAAAAYGLNFDPSSPGLSSPDEAETYHADVRTVGKDGASESISAAGKNRASDSSKLFIVVFWRASAVVLVLLALGFTLCRLFAPWLWQHHSQSPVAAAGEAWLDGGDSAKSMGGVGSLRVLAPAYFIDIGSSAESLRTSRRAHHLEKKGWTGICVAPLPGDIRHRSCKKFVLPVSGEDADKVTVEDCAHATSLGVAELFRQLLGLGQRSAVCPEVTLPAVGISTLLDRVAAPQVIGYASVEMRGHELAILRHFPFSQHCVRAWTIRHDHNNEAMLAMRSFLQVSHGCRVHEGDGELWARCPCKAGAQGGGTDHADSSASLAEDADMEKMSKGLMRKEKVTLLPDGDVAPTVL